MRVLGIDPGLRLTGYGCLEADAPEAFACDVQLVEAGIIRLAAAGASVADRLVELDRDLSALLERTGPDLVCIEELFSHYKRPQTAVIMAHGRGVILLAVRRAGLPVAEFKPTAVKKSLTGAGHASKEQMQRAIQMRFGLAEPPSPPDVADALAIALCGLWRSGMQKAGQ